MRQIIISLFFWSILLVACKSHNKIKQPSLLLLDNTNSMACFGFKDSLMKYIFKSTYVFKNDSVYVTTVPLDSLIKVYKTCILTLNKKDIQELFPTYRHNDNGKISMIPNEVRTDTTCHLVFRYIYFDLLCRKRVYHWDLNRYNYPAYYLMGIDYDCKTGQIMSIKIEDSNQHEGRI
jgi:hypothetical protein